MMRIALGVEYDGANFSGWQVQQEDVRTVQACVETALSKVANHPLGIVCAGRTDAGVHALGQVCHLETQAQRPSRAWIRGTNSHLPEDISILWSLAVPETFHARFSALARRYRYLILNRAVRSALHRQRATWFYRPLDVERMAQAARSLIGEHDFTSFRAVACQARTPVRSVYTLEVTRKDDFVILEVEANGFLHHMVRNIAGVLMAIGTGARPVRWAQEVLESRDRTLGGVTAPPEGLYLIQVRYPEIFRIPGCHPATPSW